MRKVAHKTGLHIMAWVCLFIGLLGLILPILPGLPFLVVGLYFLSLASLWFALKIEVLKVKYPVFAEYFDKFDRKASKIFKKAY